MNLRIAAPSAALLGTVALVAGCAPDTPERVAGDSSAARGDSSVARNEAGQPGAAPDRNADGGSIRPPTTTTAPAVPSAAAPPAATPRLLARAEVRPLEDNTVRGFVEFQTAASGAGPMTIHVALMGLEAGPHGMHVHSGLDCTTPGTHLNPLNSPHGAANADAAARHLGDLGNITADASGMVEEMLRDKQLGADSSFIGKVIIVHKGQDDLSTQPDGGAGEPIACGIIEPAGDLLSLGDTPNRGI